MMAKFILSCESTIDFPYAYAIEREIPVLFYNYMVDGKTCVDNMGRDPEALAAFYTMLEGKSLPTTSQLNQNAYEEFFAEQLQKGDVLHIVFGSGMTNSIQNAEAAAEVMRAKYTDRKLIVIDSTCSCGGYGMLVDYAADLRDAGKTIEETAEWVTDHCRNIHHQFFSTRLDFFRRSGRISGRAALLATVLGICPIMRLDDAGKIIVYDKVRGKQKAIDKTLDEMEQHAENGADYGGKCVICHSNCLDDALKLKAALLNRFKRLGDFAVKIYDIGMVITAHCGPGTVSVFFLGDKRLPQQ